MLASPLDFETEPRYDFRHSPRCLGREALHALTDCETPAIGAYFETGDAAGMRGAR